MLKKYYITAFYVLLSILLFGFLGPALVSSSSTIAVSIGILLIFFVWVPITYVIASKTIKNILNGG